MEREESEKSWKILSRIVRSLGENGIRSVGIFIESKNKLASKSKYLKQVFYVKDREEPSCEQ